MLQVTIPATEYYDEAKERFVEIKRPTILQLEHSLLSISKWESKWHIPFLGKDLKTDEAMVDYVRCMTIASKDVDPVVYYAIPADVTKQINGYIENPMTATTFSDRQNNKFNREIITAEIIYYWMVSLEIPFDPCEKWHLNRLLALVRVCNIKNGPEKKMSKRDIMNQNRSLNAARKQRLGTRG